MNGQIQKMKADVLAQDPDHETYLYPSKALFTGRRSEECSTKRASIVAFPATCRYNSIRKSAQ